MTFLILVDNLCEIFFCMVDSLEYDGGVGSFFPTLKVVTGGYEAVVETSPDWGLVSRNNGKIIISSKLPIELHDYFCRLSVSTNTGQTFDDILVEMDENDALRSEFIRYANMHYQLVVEHFLPFKSNPNAQVALAVANMMLQKTKPVDDFDYQCQTDVSKVNANVRAILADY